MVSGVAIGRHRPEELQTNLPGSIVLLLRAKMQATDRGVTEIEVSYRQHGSALLLFAAALTGERSRAQDAVHQVFLKLLETGRLHDTLDAKAYLFRCVRNAVLNDRKARQRDIALDPECAWFEPPNRDYAAELNLRRALWGLPEDQREVTTLHIWGELTFAQIAEVLSISANTVASRYRYALAKLREAMCAKEDCRAHS
jgi:RNA polymerase sigma-70 factor, ECF subfamily